MKIIVTGGAGFIGSHLVDALVARRDDVHVIDNLSTGRRERVHPKAVLHECDIRDFERIAPIFSGATSVFHLAALPRVPFSIKEPRLTHDVNVNGTLHVFLASRDAGVRRVVYASSSSVYGDQERLPLIEDMAPRPMSPYGLHKYVGEHMARLFSELYGLETVSLRYFNVYGPHAVTEGPYALVIGKFLEQRRRGEPLTIVPDGTQTRGYTHIRDVVHANLLAAESANVGRGEVINVGGGRNWSVLEIASLIGGPTTFIDPRVEPKHTLADITRAKELLGWEPHVQFENGIGELKTLYKIA